MELNTKNVFKNVCCLTVKFNKKLRWHTSKKYNKIVLNYVVIIQLIQFWNCINNINIIIIDYHIINTSNILKENPNDEYTAVNICLHSASKNNSNIL